MTDHPTNGLDEIVHQRHRLGILTIAAEAKRAEFGYLRETLGLTAGNLSRHLTVLEDAGLIEVEKGYAGRRPRTWGPDHAPRPVSAGRRTGRARGPGAAAVSTEPTIRVGIAQPSFHSRT